jgi:maleate cis-trans isomerase
LAYACLSCSFVGGPGYDREIAELLSKLGGCPATTGTTALLCALRAMDIRAVAVLSPYDDDRNKIFEEVLADAGVTCVGLTSFKVPPQVREFFESVGMPGVSQTRSPELAYRLGKRADRPEAQAIVIGSTNFRTAPMVAALERDAGKPVLTANQVVIWHALELCGVHIANESAGSLFRVRMKRPRTAAEERTHAAGRERWENKDV